MLENPYASRLKGIAWAGLVLSMVLAFVSDVIDPIDSYRGIDETAAAWKAITGVLADAFASIGIAAAIGWMVLRGVEWRLAQDADKATSAARAANLSIARTLEEIRASADEESKR